MVEFVSDSTNTSTTDDQFNASKLNSSKKPLDSLDSKADDHVFADSFFDYESIEDWIEELSTPVMADAETVVFEADVKRSDSNVDGCFNNQSTTVFEPKVERSVPIVGRLQPIVDGPAAAVEQARGGTADQSTGLNCIIEEGMSKVSLISGSESSVIAGVNTDKSELECHEDDSGSDVESQGSSSASTTSSGRSSDESRGSKDEEEYYSWSSGSGNSSGDDEEEEFVINFRHDGEIGDLEEGEIRDFDVAEMPDGTEDANADEEVSGDHMVAWTDDSDNGDEEEAGVKGGPIISKNELKALPPVPQVYATLQPHHGTVPVGVVLSIIGNQVIVEGVEKHDPLSEGSILWITESKLPLGLVDEIFGPVKNPYYSVRYNSENEIPSGIHGGTHISFVPEFANHVLNNKDLFKKGYDASGVNDEEVSDGEEFSDDEKELEFKRMQRLSKRAMNDQKQENRNNTRKKKNSSRGRKFGQPISQQAKMPEFNKLDQPISQQAKIDMVQPSSNQNLQGIPPLAPFVNHGSFPNPSAAGQCYNNGTCVIPSFPSTYNPYFTPSMNGIWLSGMPFQHQHQHQQNPFFPNGPPMNSMPHNRPPMNGMSPNGPPMNGMPWLPQNPALQLPQMPMPSTFPALAYPQGLAGGTPPSLPNPLTNQVEQGIQPGGMQFGQNQNMRPPLLISMEATQQLDPGNLQPPIAFPGNVGTPRQFNPGSSSRPGRKPYARGGGGSHFRGRRGQRKT